MLFLCSFHHKLCFVPFGHFAIVFQNIRTLRSTRCDVMMIQIVPMLPPLFLSPSEFIIRVVACYMLFHIVSQIKTSLLSQARRKLNKINTICKSVRRRKDLNLASFPGSQAIKDRAFVAYTYRPTTSAALPLSLP